MILQMNLINLFSSVFSVIEHWFHTLFFIRKFFQFSAEAEYSYVSVDENIPIFSDYSEKHSYFRMYWSSNYNMTHIPGERVGGR